MVVLLFCNEQGHCTRGAMERVAEHYHFPVYDIGKRLIDRMEEGSLTWQEYGQDYVHPTPYGHQLITEYLLQLFRVDKTSDGEFLSSMLPEEPAFEGAFRKTELFDLAEKMKAAIPGEIIFEGEISARMILMEFWQDSVPNNASVLVALDGKTIAAAEAYASMAWGNHG